MPESQKFKSILLFGPPGAGKGTQGKILDAIPGFFHLSVGDIFRSIDSSSPEGQEVSKYTSAGQLVPDELTIRIWKQAMDGFISSGKYNPQKDILLLDGMPRNVAQTELIAGYIEVSKIINLSCDEEDEMVKRIQQRAIEEKRGDDTNEDVIRQRFEVYRQQTRPVLDQYSADQIAVAKAVGTPAEVLGRILEIAIPIQNEHILQSN